MLRLSRLDAPRVLHHVSGRGIEQRKIFRSDKDCNDFIDRPDPGPGRRHGNPTIQERIICDTLKRYGSGPQAGIGRWFSPAAIFIGELRSWSRRRAVVRDGRAMSWIGIRELGYSGADVAKYFGVTNSCVTRMISTGKKHDIDDINLEL